MSSHDPKINYHCGDLWRENVCECPANSPDRSPPQGARTWKNSEVRAPRSHKRWWELGEHPRFAPPIPEVGGGGGVSNGWCIKMPFVFAISGYWSHSQVSIAKLGTYHLLACLMASCILIFLWRLFAIIREKSFNFCLPCEYGRGHLKYIFLSIPLKKRRVEYNQIIVILIILIILSIKWQLPI